MWSATWASVASRRRWVACHSGTTVSHVDMSRGSRPRRSSSASSPACQRAHVRRDEERDERHHADAAVGRPAGSARRPARCADGRTAARAEECEKITGASATSRASCMVDGATCDRSTSMPIRCISRTTSRPKSVRPPALGLVGGRVRPAHVAVVGQRHVTDAERVQRAQHAQGRRDRVAALRAEQRGDLPGGEDPFHVGGAWSPARAAPGRRRIIRCTRSICSSTAVTAASPASVRGHVDRPELGADAAARPAAAGRSGSCGTGSVSRARTGSPPNCSRISHGRSLCPSMSGKRRSRSRAAASRSVIASP